MLTGNKRDPFQNNHISLQYKIYIIFNMFLSDNAVCINCKPWIQYDSFHPDIRRCYFAITNDSNPQK